MRILKELLESQFEKNGKFKAEMLNLKADSLRSDPIGRDRLGYSYWFTQDKDCNVRVYQEHLDENSWKIVASNREEFVNLINRLKANEMVSSIGIGSIDEESTASSDLNQDSNFSCGSHTNFAFKTDPENEAVAPFKLKIENINAEADKSIKKPNIKLKFSHQNGLDYVENISENSSLNDVSKMDDCFQFNLIFQPLEIYK